MNKRFIQSITIAVFLLFFYNTASALEGNNSIKVGGVFNQVGRMFQVDYERMINKRFAVGGRFATIDYDFEDGDYEEEGDGSGIEGTFRYYFAKEGFNGFYLGASVGYWAIDWKYKDIENGVNTKGDGESFALNLAGMVGWKIGFGSSNFYIDPFLMVGNYFSVSTDNTTDDGSDEDIETDLGIYAGLGLSIGLTF